MKNIIFILVMLVISEMGYSQVRRPVNPRPRPTPVGPIDPFLPPYAPSRCAVDFVAHRIRVTKISNTRFRYQAYVRNQGTATYTTASNASGPRIYAYTFNALRPNSEMTFTSLAPGETKLISGEIDWPTNNEFLPPVNVVVSHHTEFDTQRDCNYSNNSSYISADQIKEIMNRR